MEIKGITSVSIEKIYSHPDNPRKDVGDVSELAESIKKNGIMQNLTVIPGNWSADSERSGGCEDNPCGVDAEEIWMECTGHLQELNKQFSIWTHRLPDKYLEALHQEALSLAAGLERIQIARAQNV